MGKVYQRLIASAEYEEAADLATDYKLLDTMVIEAAFMAFSLSA